MNAARRSLVACVLALAGCPTVELGVTPSEIGTCNPNGGESYFEAKIWSQYLRSTATTCGTNHDQPCDCAQSKCHGGSHDPAFDTNDPPAYDAMYRLSQQYLICGTPSTSPLLTKPLAGIDGHNGGDLFTTSDPQYQIFLEWFD